MELLTTIPLRLDGTVVVDVPAGRNQTQRYVFTVDEETGAGVHSDVTEEHAEYLLQRGNFMSRAELLDELDLQRRIEARRARSQVVASTSVGTFTPNADGSLPDDFTEGDHLPQEGGVKPTGRVRKAGK